MGSLSVNAYAKINLNLTVTGKLENGYHTIKSVMQSVSLCDIVTLNLNNSGIITINSDDNSMPLDDTNIACKAAKNFFRTADINSGLSVYIEKNIPQKAGLGGGSADGAAVLTGLNNLFDNLFSREQLLSLGAKIGADIPFCITGGTCLCEGIGEKITALPPLPDCKIIIAKGADGISTITAYQEIDKIISKCEYDKYNFDISVYSKGLPEIAKSASNIFEAVTNLPDILKIKTIMKSHGALTALMSGSGSAIFALFDRSAESKAKACLEDLAGNGFWAQECVNNS